MLGRTAVILFQTHRTAVCLQWGAPISPVEEHGKKDYYSSLLRMDVCQKNYTEYMGGTRV
jgi:hypothetical protein